MSLLAFNGSLWHVSMQVLRLMLKPHALTASLRHLSRDGLQCDGCWSCCLGRMSQGLDIGRDDSEYTVPDPTEDSLVTFDEFPGLSIANKVGVRELHPL